MACENCGLPEGALQGDADGHKVQIIRRAANGYQRDKKVTVWVCSVECGVQAWGISKYGKATSKWPVTLAQVRGEVKRKDALSPAA